MTRMFSLARWGAFVLSLFAAALQAQELPLDYFTKSDETGTIKLSPEGDYLAITTGQHGAEFLTFVNLKDTKVGASVRAPNGLYIGDFHWVSNTRVVFDLSERFAGLDAPVTTGEIFGVDRDGGRQKLIYGFRAQEMSTGTLRRVRDASYAHADIVSLLPGDDRNVLIAERAWRQSGNVYRFDPYAKPTISRLDVYSGKETRLGSVPVAGADVIVDAEEVPRFAIGLKENRQLSVVWKPTKDATAWEEFDLPGFRENTVTPLRFSSDNSAVLFTGVREGQRYAALFQMTLADKSIKQLIEIPDTDVQDVVTDFRDRDVIGVVGYTDKLTYRWMLPDHPDAKLQQALHRAFDGNQVRFVSKSADGKLAVVFVNSDIAPGEYLLFDTTTKQADMIRASRGWVDIKKMRPRQPIHLTARDGLPLHGYLTRPAGEGPHPLIVLPHGGPHGIRDEWDFDWESQLFANRGYAVLQLNFRGSGGYGIDYLEAGYRQWGAKMQDDLTDATKWAIEKQFTSADRICIYGGSYGGYAALMGVVREPKLYQCAIGYAGVYDLPLMYEEGDIPDTEMGVEYLDLVLGSDAADLRNRSATTHAKAIEVPVYLIHGTEDWRADHKHAVLMKKELERAGKPVEWLELPRTGHGVFDDATRARVYEEILRFLDKHLKKPQGS